jgi:hypothetical protein
MTSAPMRARHRIAAALCLAAALSAIGPGSAHAQTNYLSVGQAQAAIPGQEIQAIAWLQSYLALEPEGQDANRVRQEIARLADVSKAQLAALLSVAGEAALKAAKPEEPPGAILQDLKGGPIHEVAVWWAKLGDAETALKTASLIKQPLWRAWAQVAVGAALGDAGGKARAGDILMLAAQTSMEGADPEFEVKRAVAYEQARLGYVDAGFRTADSISRGYSNSIAKTAVALAQIEAGDAVGAKKTLGLALQTAADIRETGRLPADARARIAYAYIKVGDFAEATRIAGLIPAFEVQQEVREYVRWAQTQPPPAVPSPITKEEWVKRTADAVGTLDSAGLQEVLARARNGQLGFDQLRETVASLVDVRSLAVRGPT